jgi:hypothetical protein
VSSSINACLSLVWQVHLELSQSRASGDVSVRVRTGSGTGPPRGANSPTLEPLIPRGGPVLDPGLTAREAAPGTVDGEGELCRALADWFQKLDVNLDGAHFFLEEIRCSQISVHVQGYLAHKKPTPLGPYSSPMHRALWWSYGGGALPLGPTPLYVL